MGRILIAKPSITDLEIKYVNDAIRNGWGSGCYEYIQRFERLFAEYVGVKYALATSSCTGAMHLALAALGIGQGDEVIVPEITWVACASSVLYVGAEPVFADVLPNTWCLDPAAVEKAISPRTKAIMPVHVYGNVAEMDEILAIAGEHGLFVIEDAAEALGSEYKDRKVGSIADCGVFSFHGTKTASTGEGGMFVTSDKELYGKVYTLANQGRNSAETRMFFPHSIGLKYKMSNLQAAMGCAQIERAQELVSRKRQIFGLYEECFSNADGITMNHEQPYAKCSYWMPTALFDRWMDVDRDELMRYLGEKGIDSRPFFYPLSSLPMFEEKRENSVAYDIHDRGVNLPGHFGLTEGDVRAVADAVMQFIGLRSYI